MALLLGKERTSCLQSAIPSTSLVRVTTAGKLRRRMFHSSRTALTGARRIFQGAATPAEVPAERKEAAEIAAEQGQSPEAAALQEEVELKRQGGIGSRIKRFFLGEKFDRKRLAALGLGAVASYGFVSNATYGAGMAVSWVAFVRQTGRSPLMPGEWKAFLAFFAGFWTLQHFLRPLRFTVAIAMAPFFDGLIVRLQKLTGWNKRNAFGLYLFLFGSFTSFLVFGSIFVFGGPRAFARS